MDKQELFTGLREGLKLMTVEKTNLVVMPLENFLIGDNCLETAINFAQHVNKTVELNYEAMGLTGNTVQGSPIAPTVAYIDPYLSSDGHARVLLYDVAHDREFISFHDIHMQVQTSPATPVIGHTRNLATKDGYYQLDNVLSQINGGAPHYLTTQIDVANGFPSENRYLRSTQQSKFIESVSNALKTNRKLINIKGTTTEKLGFLGREEGIACQVSVALSKK